MPGNLWWERYWDWFLSWRNRWNHGDIVRGGRKRLECNACPGPLCCGGIQLWLQPLGSGYELARPFLPSRISRQEDIEAADVVVNMLKMGLKPLISDARSFLGDANHSTRLWGSNNATCIWQIWLMRLLSWHWTTLMSFKRRYRIWPTWFIFWSVRLPRPLWGWWSASRDEISLSWMASRTGIASLVLVRQ